MMGDPTNNNLSVRAEGGTETCATACATTHPTKTVELGERPNRMSASELYANLMGQMETVKEGDIAKLISVAVCHAKPRSNAAWTQLAKAHYSAFFDVPAGSVFFQYLRAHLIAAMLKEEPEWWEEDEIGDMTAQDDPAAIQLATETSYALVKGFFDGEYKVLRDNLKTTFASPATNEMLKQSARKLAQLVPVLVKWSVSRTQVFPPMVPEPTTTVAPHPLWESAVKMPGQMRALFSTHVYVVNLVDEGVIAPEVNQRLATQAINAFEEFARSEDGMRTDPAELNDAFWTVQKASHLTSAIPEVVDILKHIEGAVRRYLIELGLGRPEEQNGWMNTEQGKQVPNEAWFSIHRGASSHSTHDHVDAQLAVVYYPKVKEGDGRLVFEDPRGARHVSEGNPIPFAPFAGNRQHVEPRSGDLVIFPGWLYHAVDPSAIDSDEYRVSLSVNIDGYWERSVA
jgi:uncharacterized protein (TIGR02466 family)